jgi:hypothetical protein
MEEIGSHLLLKCPERQMWREEMLDNEWPHIKRKIVIGKILPVKNATEQRNLGTLSNKIKCKCENQVKKERQRLGGEQELDCM